MLALAQLGQPAGAEHMLKQPGVEIHSQEEEGWRMQRPGQLGVALSADSFYAAFLKQLWERFDWT